MDLLRLCLGQRPRSADVTTQQAEITEAEEAAVRFIEALCAGQDEAQIDYTKIRQNLNGIYLANNWKRHYIQMIFYSLQKAIETGHLTRGALQGLYRGFDSQNIDLRGPVAELPIPVIARKILVLLVGAEAIESAEREICEGELLSNHDLSSLP
jgi:hypothetical protein